eukprot:6214081-Pleurochrysis_carterae.AAC.1
MWPYVGTCGRTKVHVASSPPPLQQDRRSLVTYNCLCRRAVCREGISIYVTNSESAGVTTKDRCLVYASERLRSSFTYGTGPGTDAHRAEARQTCWTETLSSQSCELSLVASFISLFTVLCGARHHVRAFASSERSFRLFGGLPARCCVSPSFLPRLVLSPRSASNGRFGSSTDQFYRFGRAWVRDSEAPPDKDAGYFAPFGRDCR